MPVARISNSAAIPVPEKTGQPETAIQEELDGLVATVHGKNILIIRSVDAQWVAGSRGGAIFVQGSLRRLWLGAVLLETRRIRKADRGPATQDALDRRLRRAFDEKDPIGQDEVARQIGGEPRIAAWLRDHGFAEIAFGNSSQPAGAGRTDLGVPADGATADGIAYALGEIFAGRALPESAGQLYLAQFAAGTSPSRNAAAGWHVLSLTGASSAADHRSPNASGVALVRSRSGQRYVIVAVAEGSDKPAARRDTLLAGAISILERGGAP